MSEKKKLEIQFLKMEEDQLLQFQVHLRVRLQVPHQVQARIQTPPPQGILLNHEFSRISLFLCRIVRNLKLF